MFVVVLTTCLGGLSKYLNSESFVSWKRCNHDLLAVSMIAVGVVMIDARWSRATTAAAGTRMLLGEVQRAATDVFRELTWEVTPGPDGGSRTTDSAVLSKYHEVILGVCVLSKSLSQCGGWGK